MVAGIMAQIPCGSWEAMPQDKQFPTTDLSLQQTAWDSFNKASVGAVRKLVPEKLPQWRLAGELVKGV